MIANPRQEAYNIRKAGMHTAVDHQLQTVDSRTALHSMMRTQGSSSSTDYSSNRSVKRPLENDSDDEQAHDEVRLWEDGFKERYYESKFDVSSDNLEFR